MSDVALILGESASGKSRSVKNLPPKHTFIVNVVGKRFPFPKSQTLYPPFDIETGEGNVLTTKSTKTIAKVLKYVSTNRPDIRFIVIDDNQYISLFTYTARIDEKDWAKFNTIAVNLIELTELCKSFRDNLMVFILQHVEAGLDVNGNDQVQAKTMGKFVKEKVTYEGLFDTVLLCDKEEDEQGDVKHFFWTRKARSTVKTAEGMFPDQKIPNDLMLVAKAMHEYFH
jgi:hypothetical protein